MVAMDREHWQANIEVGVVKVHTPATKEVGGGGGLDEQVQLLVLGGGGVLKARLHQLHRQ
jgi:hypothetical protein